MSSQLPNDYERGYGGNYSERERERELEFRDDGYQRHSQRSGEARSGEAYTPRDGYNPRERYASPGEWNKTSSEYTGQHRDYPGYYSNPQGDYYSSRGYDPSQPSYEPGEVEPGEYTPYHGEDYREHQAPPSPITGYKSPLAEERTYDQPREEEYSRRREDKHEEQQPQPGRERLKALWHSQQPEPPAPGPSFEPFKKQATLAAPPTVPLTPVSPVDNLVSRLSGPVVPTVSEQSVASYDSTPGEPGPTDIQLYISGDVAAPTLSQVPPTATAPGRSLRGCGWIDVVLDGVERQAFVGVHIMELPADRRSTLLCRFQRCRLWPWLRLRQGQRWISKRCPRLWRSQTNPRPSSLVWPLPFPSRPSPLCRPRCRR